MKKLITLILLSFAIEVSAQTTKPDSTYKLTEPQVYQISQLLDYGLKLAGNSDKISTRDYNEFARQVASIDSLFRMRYMQLHPVKPKEVKK